MHETCHDPGRRSVLRSATIACAVPDPDEEHDAELWWQRIGGRPYGPDGLGDCDARAATLPEPIGGGWLRSRYRLASGPCWRPDFTDCDPS